MDSFPRRLKSLREEKGLDQVELSKLVDMTNVSISRYETGERKNPGRSQLIKLANFFNVSIDYLVGDTDCKESIGVKEMEEVFCSLSKEENKLKAISFVKYLKTEEENERNNNKA